ncbi:hypothetical protein D3C80_2064010 [compost metagenome]
MQDRFDLAVDRHLVAQHPLGVDLVVIEQAIGRETPVSKYQRVVVGMARQTQGAAAGVLLVTRVDMVIQQVEAEQAAVEVRRGEV